MAGAQVQDVYAGIAGEHVQAMTSKGIVAVSDDEINKRRRRPRERGGARAGDSARTASCCTRFRRSTRSTRNVGIRDPDRHERHAPRDGDVPRHDRQLAGDEPAEVGRARRLQGARAGARAARERASPCSPRTRRSSASRSWRWAPARPTSPIFHEGKIRHPRHHRLRRQQRHERHRARARRDAGRRRAAEGAYGCAYEPLVDPSDDHPAAEHRGAGRPADPARVAGAHHPPADGRDLRSGAARHRRRPAIAGQAERRRRADGWRGGDAGGRPSWRATCSAPACGSASPAENIGGLVRLGRGAALRDGGGLAQYGAHRLALGGGGAWRQPPRGDRRRRDGEDRRTGSRSGCRISSDSRIVRRGRSTTWR